MSVLGELTIVHSYAGGTTIEDVAPSSRAHVATELDGAWAWSKGSGVWRLHSSQFRTPRYGAIEAVVERLEQRGYEVRRRIDPWMPTFERQEADRARRMYERAKRLKQLARKLAAEAAARQEAFCEALGYSSTWDVLLGRATSGAERARGREAVKSAFEAFQMMLRSEELEREAERAAAHTGLRYAPAAIRRRIRELESGRRGLEQRLLSEVEAEARKRLVRTADELDKQITGWKRAYAVLRAAENGSKLGPDNVCVDDWVLIGDQWFRVRDVYEESVTVPVTKFAPAVPGRGYVEPKPYREICEHRTTAQMPPGFVAAYETPGTDRTQLDPADFAADQPPQ